MKKLIGFAGTYLAIMPLAAFALTQRESDTLLEEIVITAQKRTERLVDAPQTVNVVTGAQLEQFNITQFQDITKLVPGLDITRGDGRQQSVSLRGVKYDPDSQTSNTVDVYLNEVPFESTQAIQAQFDVDSIQVLRGPQGTLRGGTGPSGAILIGTRQPNLHDFKADVTASYTDRSATNVQAGISVPIVDSMLAVRIAGLYDHNKVNGVYDIVSGLHDDSKSYGERVSLLFQPLENLSFLLMHQEFSAKAQILRPVTSTPDGVTGQFGYIGPDAREAVSDGGNYFETRGRATILNATWDFLGQRLSYVGSYQNNDFDTTRDLDIGNGLYGVLFGFLPVGPAQSYQKIDINTHTDTNELRFERTGDHFWIYRAGFYARNTKSPFSAFIDYTGANGACQSAPGPLLAVSAQLPCVELAGSRPTFIHDRGYFTTQTLNLTARDTLDLGIRYSETDNDAGANSSKYNAWTGSAYFKHKFSDAIMVYANYGRSFRPGGYDSSGAQTSLGTIPDSFFRWNAEKSDAIELGIRGLLLDNRLSYSLAGYQQKFKGFINRVNNVTCSSTLDGNPGCGSGDSVNLTYQGDAIARGVEAEIRMQLTPAWNAQLTATYTDAHYDNAAIPCNDYNGDGVPDQGEGFSGGPLVQVGKYVSTCNSSDQVSSLPKTQLSANSEYDFALNDDWKLFVRGLARYGSSRKDPNTGVQGDSTFKVDAAVGVRALGGELNIFARNVFDQQRNTTGGDIFDLFTQPTHYKGIDYDQRREVGMQVRWSY